MHVLGTPPAFILSQDQTLRKKISRLSAFPFLFRIAFLNRRIYTSYHSSVVKVLAFLLRGPDSTGLFLICQGFFQELRADKIADVSSFPIGQSCDFYSGWSSGQSTTCNRFARCRAKPLLNLKTYILHLLLDPVKGLSTSISPMVLLPTGQARSPQCLGSIVQICHRQDRYCGRLSLL